MDTLLAIAWRLFTYPFLLCLEILAGAGVLAVVLRGTSRAMPLRWAAERRRWMLVLAGLVALAGTAWAFYSLDRLLVATVEEALEEWAGPSRVGTP